MKKKEVEYKWKKEETLFFLKLVEEYKEKFNMVGWRMDTQFVDGAIKEEDGFKTDAETIVTFDYEYAEIRFYPGVLKYYRARDIQSVKAIVAHEIIHGLVSELMDLAHNRYATKEAIDNSVERLVQRLAMIVK